jgi:AmiR/NasT family two-component response regulator
LLERQAMNNGRRLRWRVLVVDDHVQSRNGLAAAVTQAGGAVVAECGSAEEAPGLIATIRPDVAIFAVGLGDGDGIAAARAVMAATPCPIVLFTSHRGDSFVKRAAEAGVMTFLLKPLRAEEVSPVLDLAVARFGDIQELRRSLASRKLIERAKGLLMKRRGIAEDDAFRLLRTTAMNQRRPMAEVAQAVLLAESLGTEGPGDGEVRAGVTRPGAVRTL